MAARLYKYKSSALPQLDLKTLASAARKILDLLAYFSRMRSSSEPNHLLNKILAKFITFIDTIDASVLVAQMGYQLATDAMILCCGTEEERREFHARLESMRDISGNGQEISRFIRDGFRDIKQQIYEIADSTKDNTFIVVIPPNPTDTEALKIPMKDIGTALVANIDLLTEFSCSVEATAKWWNYVKVDLEGPTPTILPFEKGSSDVSKIFSKWAEMQQGFQQYHNVVNSVHKHFPELLVSSSAN